MNSKTYQAALNRIKVGADVTMKNPEPVSFVEKGTKGNITRLDGNSLNNPKETRVQVRWLLDGKEVHDHYALYDVPFIMDISA